MKSDHRDALLFALERGIAAPNGNDNWFFCNASPISGLPDAWKSVLVCKQDLRPEFLKLESHGYEVNNHANELNSEHVGAMYLLGRNRQKNQHMITRLWNGLGVGGRLIVAGNKTDGVGSIRKWFSSNMEAVDGVSKYHAVVFWADKKPDSKTIPEPNITREIAGYQLADGMFSSDGPDRGSKLLVEHFDQRIRGKVADLGAAWGYLSCELLKRTNQISEIDLFEADQNAILAAERNLHGIGSGERKFHWCDVITEFPKRPYDWVIMNPPFHSSRAAEPELGQRFIEVAASTLPNGGRLLMVANRNLPYEGVLSQKFRKFEKLAERNGFKVIEAVK